MLEEKNLSHQEVKAVEEHDDVEFGKQNHQDNSWIRFDLCHDKIVQLHNERSHENQNGRYFQTFPWHILVNLIDWFQGAKCYRHKDNERDNHEVERAKKRHYIVNIDLHGTILV